jgi:phosphotransferase system HPr (HPr) family protein
MHKQQTTVLNKYGIHARPSAAIVQEAVKYESHIKITNLHENITVNAKSVLEVLSLKGSQGTELLIEAFGKDEEAACNGVTDKIKEISLKTERD